MVEQVQRQRDLVVIGGWVSEYCARQEYLPPPAEVLARVFPGSAPKQAATVELSPAEIRRMFVELTEAFGGEVLIP